LPVRFNRNTLASVRIEHRAQLLDSLAIDRDDVEAARRKRVHSGQEVTRRQHKAALLRSSDTRRSPAVRRVHSAAHLDKHQGPVALTCRIKSISPPRACGPRATR